MEKKLVFCIKCEYNHVDGWGFSHCRYTDNLAPAYTFYRNCGMKEKHKQEDINVNNDCWWYKEKQTWWQKILASVAQW